MKIFMRENKTGLILLSILILFLLFIWNAPIYKIWWSYVIPWRDLGAPPSQVREIRYIRFSDAYGYLPVSDFKTRSNGLNPTIDVVAVDGKVYSSTNYGEWLQIEHEYAPVYPSGKVHKWECAKKIESRWGLKDEEYPNATIVFIQGKCPKDAATQYAVYLVSNDGNILGKYLGSSAVENFRFTTTNFAVMAIVLCLFVWISPFKKSYLLDEKPDYTAN
jgi:hypothetical protein